LTTNPFALSDEYAARCVATRDAYLVGKILGVTLIVGDSLVANIVHGLEKHIAPERGIAYGLTMAVAHQRNRIALLHVAIRSIDLAGIAVFTPLALTDNPL
jgi:hypothetical protein